ncbi:MAG: Lrp/AsnC ligand binding domain-containing protein [Candidatus Nezhaarchaeales archaeon]
MVKAYILMRTRPGTSQEVVAALRKVKGVIRADSVYGRFDAVILVEAESLEALSRLVYEVIGKQPNVVHTETSVVLE